MSRVSVAGVIEGFYGTPWTWAERRAISERIAAWGGNWYVWAPKSAPHHRDRWRESFDADEIEGFASLRGTGVSISVGLTPGADATLADIVEKLAAVDHVVDGYTLCFDDLEEQDAGRRHAMLVNGVAERFGRPTWIVPTHYAGTASSPYLEALVAELAPEIAVMWTGETVVCDRITRAQADARRAVCGGRRLLLWDNTPVNDAMMRDLLHLGPYVGREDSLRESIAGVLVNPMEVATASRPTVRSAIAWAFGRDHIAEWRDELDVVGLAVLAEATSFPGDHHWPGDAPGVDWWTSVSGLADPDDERLVPWVEAARSGAKAVLALLDLDGRRDDPDRAAAAVGAALAWRAWRTRGEVSSLGRGPRVRPVFTQNADGRFAALAGVATDHPSLVDLVARRVFGD